MERLMKPRSVNYRLRRSERTRENAEPRNTHPPKNNRKETKDQPRAY